MDQAAKQVTNIMDEPAMSVGMPKIPFTGQLVRDSWNFLKQNFKSIWRIQLISFVAFFLPISIISLVVSIAWSTSFSFQSFVAQVESVMDSGNTSAVFEMLGQHISIIILLAVVLVLFILFSAFVSYTAYRAIFELCNGTFTKFSDTARTSLKTLHSVIWIAILVNIITRGAYLLLYFPGLILSVWTKYSIFENFTDMREQRGLKAIISSWKITQPYFWAVLGRLILGTMLMIVAFAIPAVLVSIVTLSLLSLFAKSSVYLMVVLGVVIAIFSLGMIFLMGLVITPMFIRFEWGIFNAIRQRYSSNVLATAVEEKRYKIRKIILIILAILGILTVVFNGWRSTSGVSYLIDSNVSIIEGCGSSKCESLLTLEQIKKIAEEAPGTLQNTAVAVAGGDYEIKVLNDWKSVDGLHDKDLNLTLIQPDDEDVEVGLLIASDKTSANAQNSNKGYFIKKDGTPNVANQTGFIRSVMMGAGYDLARDKGSIYRIRPDIVSLTDISDDLVTELWVFFTEDQAYLISMMAPTDQWYTYQGAMYKMALTFVPNKASKN